MCPHHPRWLSLPPGKGSLAAHRGFRANYPENTMAAFEAAVGRCAFIECDIRLSRDLVPVVIHDPTLSRTSNFDERQPEKGRSEGRVADFDLAELKMFDMGSWFLRDDPFSTLASKTVSKGDINAILPQRIPTLMETLKWAVKAETALNIELKDLGAERFGRIMVEKTVQLVNRCSPAPVALISSFNHDYLRFCRKLDPSLPTAALVKSAHPPDTVSYLKELGVCAYHPKVDIVDPSLIGELTRQNLQVNVFTVNDLQRRKELASAGVSSVFTDFL